jgi:hypothetical protein
VKEEIDSQTSEASKTPIVVPIELERERLPFPAGTDRVLAAGKRQDSNLDSEQWSRGHEEFAKFVHTYIREFIKFADQKAGFAFATASAVLTFLVRRGAHKSLLVPLATRGFSEWAAFLACLLIGLSALLSLLVVLPRLRGRGEGVIYWKGILQSGTETNYVSKIQQSSNDALTAAVLQHCYQLAEIADRKYELLKWAIWSGVIGAVIAASVLLGL